MHSSPSRSLLQKQAERNHPSVHKSRTLPVRVYCTPSSFSTPGLTYSILPYLNDIYYVVLYYLCAYACNALCLWSIPCLKSVRAR